MIYQKLFLITLAWKIYLAPGLFSGNCVVRTTVGWCNREASLTLSKLDGITYIWQPQNRARGIGIYRTWEWRLTFGTYMEPIHHIYLIWPICTTTNLILSILLFGNNKYFWLIIAALWNIFAFVKTVIIGSDNCLSFVWNPANTSTNVVQSIRPIGLFNEIPIKMQ